MTRLILGLAALMCTPGICFADTLDTFTLSGDGHVFQFSAPSQQTVSSNPHIVDLAVYGASGTVDGSSGYTFGTVVATSQVSSLPLLLLTVSPLPSGVVASPMYGSQYMLYGPVITSLVADVPDPFSGPGSGPTDLLTFAYVPGSYSFLGYDPGHTQGNYTLQIAAATPAAVTPEPGTWLLLLTGMMGLSYAARQHRRRQVDVLTW